MVASPSMTNSKCSGHFCHSAFSIRHSSLPKCQSDQTASMSAAMPWPPPMQAVARPRFKPRRRSSRVSVSSSRVPVMPSGWPSAIAPPLTLTRSRSSPSSFSTDEILRRERLVDLDQIDVVQRQAGPLEHLARRRRRTHPHQRRLDADVGPVRQPRRAASGRDPSRPAPDASSSAAPPSTMPLALPAVTQPFLLNAAGSFASPSIVESGRM